jgi:predicted nuclease of predicted toxin-antitoxin system
LKIKLDENLGKVQARIFRDAGHDSVTVPDEAMWGVPDASLIERCREEGRALVTLDLGFSNPFVFRPSRYHGIVVLRLPRPASSLILEQLCRTVIEGLTREQLDGRLWIVEPGQLRIYQEDIDD